MEKYRIEHDSLGEVKVDASRAWGAQTQRSLKNFPIGKEKMPGSIIKAFALLKKACALSNREVNPEKMSETKKYAIVAICDEILRGAHADEFPLSVWQTGSGTQTNMNLNEVIAHLGNQKLGSDLLHPNDDVNMSQSSNDTFPTAMHIAAASAVKTEVIVALDTLISTFEDLEDEYQDVIKTGRTHLRDAVPLSFSQEISGWRASLKADRDHLQNSLDGLCELAIGGTAVGTGLNAPSGFGDRVASHLSELTHLPFVSAENKFRALTSLDHLVFAHGALKALAADLMKIANDIRWLSSGPRCGLGEIFIPENEPGSSIMPGKVNPTQCEAVTMVCCQVMGNDATLGFCASQGNFELNVFLPVSAFNFLQSCRLLTDAMLSFEKRCVRGIRPNKEKMQENLERTLMTVTALSPVIGYENAAEVAKTAYREDLSLKEACLSLGFLEEEKFDELFKPEEMI